MPNPTPATTTTFEIGRQDAHHFYVYDTVTGEEAAVASMHSQIVSVSSPQEIYIFEQGAGQPSRDLMDMAWVGVTRTEGD